VPAIFVKIPGFKFIVTSPAEPLLDSYLWVGISGFPIIDKTGASAPAGRDFGIISTATISPETEAKYLREIDAEIKVLGKLLDPSLTVSELLGSEKAGAGFTLNKIDINIIFESIDLNFTHRVLHNLAEYSSVG